MSIFGNQSATRHTLDEVAQMVHRYFKTRSLDPKVQEISDTPGFGWWLNEGSARIYIFLQDTPGGPVIRITSPIVYIPRQGQLEFYRRLLDINATLTCCALSTSEDTVVVVSQRHTFQLEQAELDDMIWNVSYVADLLDDKLVSEFNTKRYQS